MKREQPIGQGVKPPSKGWKNEADRLRYERLRSDPVALEAERVRKREGQRARRLADPDRAREQSSRNAAAWRARNPELARRRQKDADLRRLYGITVEQWDALFVAQGCVCACCGASEPGSVHGWHTEHKHGTSPALIRGITCHSCNLLLGNAKDDVARLRSAIHYLERHQ